MGGPGKLATLVIGGSMVIGGVVVKTGEFAVKKGKSALKKRKELKKASNGDIDKIYIVNQYGESNEGIKFQVGDKIRIFEKDEEAILIELIGSEYNPYFVSLDLLQQILDFDEELEKLISN